MLPRISAPTAICRRRSGRWRPCFPAGSRQRDGCRSASPDSLPERNNVETIQYDRRPTEISSSTDGNRQLSAQPWRTRWRSQVDESRDFSHESFHSLGEGLLSAHEGG